MAGVVERPGAVDSSGVLANQRLTALTGALLFVLLGLMGLTVLSVRSLLPQHLFIGFVLIPPLTLKVASTGYRFAKYYLGDTRYRTAGPPELYLRLLGPLVILSTIAVFLTGLELWLFGLRFGSVWVAAHRASFLVWLPVIGIHVLAHFNRTSAALSEEVSRPSPGSSRRRSLVVASLVAGLILAAASLTYSTPFIFFPER